MKEKRFDITGIIDDEARLTFNKYCKGNGYTVTTVLKYLTEHDDLVISICEEMNMKDLKRMREYLDAHTCKGRSLFRYNSVGERTITQILLDTTLQLRVSEFLCHLIVNKQIIDDICAEIPVEFRMKKFK